MVAATRYIHDEVVTERAELGVSVFIGGVVDVGCAVTATVVAGPVVVDVTVIIARAFKATSLTANAPAQAVTRKMKAVMHTALVSVISG